jgi:hypothetical protein
MYCLIILPILSPVSVAYKKCDLSICFIKTHIDDSQVISSTYGLNPERRMMDKIFCEVDNSDIPF